MRYGAWSPLGTTMLRLLHDGAITPNLASPGREPSLSSKHIQVWTSKAPLPPYPDSPLPEAYPNPGQLG
jgi:hypothetical protein